MVAQQQTIASYQEEISSHWIKCVLKKPEYLVIEGKSYPCEVKIRQLEILVEHLTTDSVKTMLVAMGLEAWELVDWWAVEMISLEPNF